MLNCQECGSTENVRRVYNMKTKEEIGLQCWDCREERIMRRMAQGGVDDRPLSGEYKENENLKSKEDNGKEGQTSLMDF